MFWPKVKVLLRNKKVLSRGRNLAKKRKGFDEM